MRRFVVRVFLLACVLSLTACANTEIPADYRWASIQGGQIERAEAGEEFYFNVPVDESLFSPKPVPIHISVSGQVNRGWLRFELRDPDGIAVWNSGQIGPGDFSIQTAYSPEPTATGMYTLGLVWSADTSAGYNLSWHALNLTAAILIPGAGMLLVALAFILYGLRRGLGWRYLLLGALFWVFTVVLKFVFAAMASPLVGQFAPPSDTDLFAPNNLLVYLYSGALTGIFEAGVAWLVLRNVRWGKASWGQALMFGIGFGAVEALLLALVSLGSSVSGLVAPELLPVPTLGNLAQNNQLAMALAPVVERISVIFAHIFACVLIFTAIARREARWGWLAILYKTLLDAPAGFAGFWGTNTPEKLWTIEAVIALVGLIGLLGTIWLARRYPRETRSPATEV